MIVQIKVEDKRLLVRGSRNAGYSSYEINVTDGCAIISLPELLWGELLDVFGADTVRKLVTENNAAIKTVQLVVA